MQKLKFISLLKNLTPQELEGFHKYLKRNHEREKIALRVFEYLIKFYPDFEPREKIRLEYAFQKIFKADFEKDSHAQKKMLNTASDLHKWLKNFLIISKTQQDLPLQQMLWLSILQERGMKEEFTRKATAFYEQARNAPQKTLSDVLSNWMANHFQKEQISWNNGLDQGKIFEQCVETMADCWEIIRLRMACEMSLIHQSIAQVPEHQIKQADEFRQESLLLLRDLYESSLRLTESGEEQHFVRLESLLIQHGQNLDPKELEWIIRYVYNFTADQSRHNQEAIHYERTHRLDKIGLAYNVFLKDGNLPSSAFCNFVHVACLTKDFEWATSFVRDYNHIILENDRQEGLLLAQAIIAFETGKLQEVIRLIEKVDFKAHLDILRAKYMLLRSYYDLQADPDIILDSCAYFENLLRRPPKTKAAKGMLAFTLILKRLVAQKSSKEMILDCIERAPLLYSKKWLLEKTVHYKARYAARKIPAKRHIPTFK